MRYRRSTIAIIGIATAVVLAVNFLLQSRPLFEWLPAVVLVGGAVLVLLLVNLGWASSIGMVMRDAKARHENHAPPR